MTTLSVQRAMLKRSPERLAIREDMFDSLLLLGKVWLSMREPSPAVESFNEAVTTARYLFDRNKHNLYSERCLAMSYRGLADYHAYLAEHGPVAQRASHYSESLAWYDKSLAIWSSWRTRGVAIPFWRIARGRFQGLAHPFCPERNLSFDHATPTLTVNSFGM